MPPSPPLSLLPWGPPACLRGPLGILPSPWGAVLALLCPPFEAFGDFADARARVSPGLRLAPALLLGLGSLYTLSPLTFTVTTWL
jgi:hypothetical protein